MARLKGNTGKYGGEESVEKCETDRSMRLLSVVLLQDAAERTPRFGRGIASGGERVVEQRCTCRFQCTPWRGWENIFEFIKNVGRR